MKRFFRNLISWIEKVWKINQGFIYLLIKIALVIAMICFLLFGFYLMLKPSIFGNILNPTRMDDIPLQNVVAWGIENTQNSIELLEWFITSLITISAGFVVFMFNLLMKANNQISDLRKQVGEASLLLDEFSQMHREMQSRLTGLPKRIVNPSITYKWIKDGYVNKEFQNESFQWWAWQKWVILGNPQGYEELKATAPEKFSTNLKIIIILEIANIKRKIKDRNDTQPSEEERDLMAKLQSLLEL